MERAQISEIEELRHLRLPLALTYASLVVERVLQAFWQCLSLIAVLVAAMAFGVADLFAPPLLRSLAAVALLAIGVSIAIGVWRFRRPRRAQAWARLDASLPGRPLSALSDRIALGADDQAARAVWDAHLRQMTQASHAVRAKPPAPKLAPRDPFGMRLAAMVALAMALMFGTPAHLSHLGSMLEIGSPGQALAADRPSWEIWATPPRYTRRAGLYLNALEDDQLLLPEGTALTVRLYGPAKELELTQSIALEALGTEPPDADIGVQVIRLEAIRSGHLAVSGPGGRVFEITVMPDAPPTVAPLGTATRRADGKFSQPFQSSDDYAVVSGQAVLALDLGAVDRRFGLAPEPEPRTVLEYDLPLPIATSRADFSEVLVEDAARHPWANLPVEMVLRVQDGREQQGESPPITLELPGRRFFDPLAAALIEMRRDLLWSRQNAPRVSQVLKALSHRPAGFVRNDRVYLMLRVAIGQIDAALANGPLADELRDELADAFWDMAILLEDGGLEDALAAMKQAQERLSEAIRNGATADEIASLMEDLKAATENYIRQLAERGEQADPSEQFAQEQQNQQISADQIQQLMDEIQRLMEDGQMAAAQALLDQLARLLENLRVVQGQGGEGDTPGGEALRELSETLRGQQGLADQVFRELQEEFGQGSGAQPSEESDEDTGGPSDSLAEQQRDLRDRLGRQQGLMPETGSPDSDDARQALEDAARAMEQAEQALRDGDNGTALDRQADAIEAMREGLRSLRDALADAQARDSDDRFGQDPNQPATGAQRDPLGRNIGEGGRIGTDDTLLQGDDVYRRARDLLDEIRRRTGDRLRPDEELDYLRRLLDQF